MKIHLSKRGMFISRIISGALLWSLVGCMALPVNAQTFKFDFGVEAGSNNPASVPEDGFTLVTRQDSFNEARGYGWTKPPVGYFDVPTTYPPNRLHRHGVATAPEGAVFVVKLPPGSYDVTAHLGITSATEFRPGMYVKANGELKARGILAGGNAAVPTFPVTVKGDRLELEFGAEVFGVKRSASLLGLEISPQRPRAITPGFTVRPALKWLETEKIRGLFGRPVMTSVDPATGRHRTANREYQADIVRAGMNLLASNFSGREGYLDEWVAFAQRQQGKFHLFDVCNLAVGPEWDEISAHIPKVVYADGRVDIKPRPLDWEVWEKMVVGPAIHHIRRARAAGGRLDGMLIDTEMYGAQVTEVYNNTTSFDAQTLAEYAKEKNLAFVLPEGVAGYKLLSEQNLLLDYLKWQEDKMAALAARAAELVRREDPDFLFGFLQWKENFWYLRALARGLGKPGVPTLVFGEDSYWGYGNDGARQREVFQAMGANAVYVPGLWPNQFSPRGLQGAATQALSDAGGYWLYGVPVLYEAQNPEEVPPAGRILPHSYLSRPATEYWQALIQANAGQHDPEKAVRTAWDSEPAQIGARDWVGKIATLPVPDQHETRLVEITVPTRPLHLFDMGIPSSPVAPGFKPVFYNTLYDAQTGYGWLNRVGGSFDRPNAEPLNDLTRDGLLVDIDNTFRMDVANDKYTVTLVLGDMNKNEVRAFQNVHINGQHVLRDVLTNGGEYRVWAFPVTVTNGKIDILFEAVGPYRDSVLAVMVGR